MAAGGLGSDRKSEIDDWKIALGFWCAVSRHIADFVFLPFVFGNKLKPQYYEKDPHFSLCRPDVCGV